MIFLLEYQRLKRSTKPDQNVGTNMLKYFPKKKKKCLKPCGKAFQRYSSMKKPENRRSEK